MLILTSMNLLTEQNRNNVYMMTHVIVLKVLILVHVTASKMYTVCMFVCVRVCVCVCPSVHACSYVSVCE